MDKATETMIANLQKNTGKSLEEWIAVVQAKGYSKHGDMLKFLKEEHGFTHGFANLVAHKAKGSDAGSAASTADLVETQYKGRETLRPYYELLVAEVRKFGRDVEISPKNAYVSLRRAGQFALIQPSTKTRLNIGLNLKGVAAAGKLENAGSFNAMCSHRIRVEKAEDIDSEVISWMKQAYEQAK